MMPPRPGVCISCEKWFDYRTKDMCWRCYRTAWQREKRRNSVSRSPKPPKPVREKRALKPIRKAEALRDAPTAASALPRGWFAGTTPESRSAWSDRFSPITTRRQSA